MQASASTGGTDLVVESEVVAGVPVHTAYVRHRGRRLAYAQFGNQAGPWRATILHHHFSGSCRLEAVALARMARIRHVRVIAIDRPGTGKSDPADGRRLADWPTDAFAVLDALGVESFTATGCAGGAAHALALGMAAPKRVQAVVLAGPLPDPSHPASRCQPWWFRAASRIFMKPGPMVFVLKQFLRHPDRYLESSLFIGEHDRHSVTEIYRDLCRRMLLEGLSQGFAGLTQELALLSAPWSLDWNSLRVPLHILCSATDPLVHHARALARLQPDARFTELAGGRLAALSPSYCDAMLRAALQAAGLKSLPGSV